MKTAPFILTATVLLTLPWSLAQPVFTKQPTNNSVSLGATVQFTAVATSSLAPITYQWWFKEAALDAVANPSAARSTLSLTNVTLTHAGPYTVVASDAGGLSVTSQVAILTVDATFTRITQGAIVSDPGNSYVPTWGDYDGDGWLDLCVANGGNEGAAAPFLYRNDQHGGFVRLTDAEIGPLATDAVQAAQAHWVDYDNNGTLDLFIGSANSSPHRLYVNEGNGHFRRITEDVGINRVGATWGSAWADYDNDGFVDLYMSAPGQGRKDQLWRNQGDGTFRQCTTIPFRVMDVNFGTWGDADNDGDVDLLVPNNGSGSSAFFRNHGDGTFTEDVSAGLGPGNGTQPLWADFTNDGYLDLIIASVPLHYYVNNQQGAFERITTGPHLAIGGGPCAGDYDNDGHLDLLIRRGQLTGDTCVLLHNEGDGVFVSVALGSLTSERGHSTRGTWADYDNDGALDLFLATVASERNVLFHNNGNAEAWLIVRLTGTVSNRDAIGAKVVVHSTVRGRPSLQMRQIGGGSLIETRAHFGLGDASQADLVRIEWPSGIVQELSNVPTRQILTLTEPPRLQALSPGRVRIQCWKGQKAEAYASDDLSAWTSLGVFTNQTGTLELTDPDAGVKPYRFYRAVSR